MDHHFRKIEDWLQYWIEGSISRFFNSQLSPSTVASNLARALEREIRIDQKGIRHAPDQFTLYLNPETMEGFEGSIDRISQSFAKGMEALAREHGYIVADSFHIQFETDPNLKVWEMRTVASYQSELLDETQRFEQKSRKEGPRLPYGAFLIIDGNRHYSLRQPVVNIGRREDNQLVIDNPRVSRTHAQLRAKDGRFLLLDVGSKAGVYVHGQRIKQHLLRPGDVITIADVELVYGEDEEPSSDETIGLRADTLPPRAKKKPKGK